MTVNKAEKSQSVSHVASKSLQQSLACSMTHGLNHLSPERAHLWILFKGWIISPTPPLSTACGKCFSRMLSALPAKALSAGVCPEMGTELGKGLETQDSLRDLRDVTLEKRRLGGTFWLCTTP